MTKAVKGDLKNSTHTLFLHIAQNNEAVLPLRANKFKDCRVKSFIFEP
jgi:hypothetical protein